MARIVTIQPSSHLAKPAKVKRRRCSRCTRIWCASNAPGFTGSMEGIIPRLREVGLQPVTPNGVLGDPTRAEATRGERYLDARVTELLAALSREPEGATDDE